MDPKDKKKNSANVQQFNKFLDNNSEFLSTKYTQYFGTGQWTLQNLNKQTTINFIYDVFGFSKYQNDPKMNKMLRDSLTQNIKQFSKKIIQKQGKNNKKSGKNSFGVQDAVFFTSEISVQLLRYCIQNNQMFAVHYDRKQAEKSQAQIKQEQKKQLQQNEVKKVQVPETQNINEQRKQDEKQQQNDQGAQILKESKASKVSFKDQKKIQNQDDPEQNQFTKNTLQKISEEQILKKIEILFRFYCKQLHSLGGHTTFDRIEHQCQSLSLGKFMVFCHATDVFSKYTQLNKKLVINTFMKISQGIKQITFQQFYDLLKKLNDLDPGLFDRLGMSNHSVFKTKKKHLTKPFGTKDLGIRQNRLYGKVKVLPRQNIHTSNRVQDSLRRSISRSRSKNGLQSASQIKSKQKNQSTRYLKHDKNGSTLINPNQVSKLSSAHLEEEVDLGFLSKLINAQDADDEWLGQYKVPLKRSKILINTSKAAVSSIRTSRPRENITQLSNLSVDQSMHLPSDNRNASRKDNLLLNMKNRIKQIQKTQKHRQYTANKRASLSLIHK